MQMEVVERKLGVGSILQKKKSVELRVGMGKLYCTMHSVLALAHLTPKPDKGR